MFAIFLDMSKFTSINQGNPLEIRKYLIDTSK